MNIIYPFLPTWGVIDKDKMLRQLNEVAEMVRASTFCSYFTIKIDFVFV